VRALANRWLEILWHCLHHKIRYDETINALNRAQTLKPAA
jgi:hypothetical protein